VTGSPFGAGNGPVGVAVSPDGRRLYVTNFGSDDVFAFAIGTDGALAAVAGSPFGTGGDGPEFQSVAIEPNQGPTAAFSPAPATAATRGEPATAAVAAGEPIRFNATASSDPDGQVTRYAWDFGDGTTLPDGGPTPSHRYTSAGDFTVTLTVTDDEGCSATRIYTGQTAHCNATAAAVARRTVSITAAQAPTAPEQPDDDTEADEDDEGTSDEADDGGVADAASIGRDRLPFTGLRLVAVLLAGAWLLATGLTLLGLTRQQKRQPRAGVVQRPR
jgi:YVTN family beta-propeller protein